MRKSIFHMANLVFIGLSMFFMQAYAGTSAAGFPDPTTLQQTHDDQDLQRAITAYRFWYPTVSTEAIFNGNREVGIKDNQGLSLLSAQPHHVGFTLNSDTPYAGGAIDLTDGPVVIELPAGKYIGLANDHHQRWIMDLGIPGDDQGLGGKYLILPPAYSGAVPSGYYIRQSDSYKVLIAIRALPAKGIKAAMDDLRAVKIYPLSSAANPKLMTFVDVNITKMDSTPLRWETNIKFWEELSAIINAEPLVAEFRPMYGVLATIGIEKGKPFAPDARMKKILEQAAKIGHDQMMVAAFASDRADRIAWPERKWEWVGLVPKNGNFETPTQLDIEARDRWFAQAIVSSPAMFQRVTGAGSLYWLGLRDKDGAYLEGGNSYELTIPLPVPAKAFWSLTVYDAATRSEVQTDQDKAALRSMFELKDNKSSTLTLYFGPTAPAGKEKFWIKTIPGKNWFAYFRIYAPDDAAFDGSWRPDDFKKII